MRLVFAGTPRFAEAALTALHQAGHEVALVLTRPDRPVGRGLHTAQSPVKQFALANGLVLMQPESLRSPEALVQVTAAAPDALVVAAYGLLLPERYLTIARLGALNIHASLLPRWRGAAPIQRALLAGDRETGISIMQMDAGLDTGPILAQQALSIDADEDAGTLHDKLALLGAELIVATLERLEAGEVTALAQPSQGANYARRIEKREALVDWKQSAEQIERMVRAFRPSPGVTTRLSGEPLKIWRAGRVTQTGTPGEIVGVGETSFVVACGEGALEVSEVQRAGGRRVAASEYLRGRPLRAGMQFE